MISLDFINHPQIPILKNIKLMPKELCYIRLPSLANLSNEMHLFIQEITLLSSEVILSIPSEDFGIDELKKNSYPWELRDFRLESLIM